MALIQCAECKGKVSKKATACPQCGAPINKKKTGNGCLLVLLIVGGIIAVILASNQRVTHPETPTPTQNQNKPIEYQLATISKGSYVSENDETVIRFKYLLDQIKSKTAYSDQDIADMTVQAHNILLKKYGKKVNLLTLMEEGWKTLSLDSGIKYEEILAAHIQLLANQ